jgi:hypothetical protein
MLPVWDNSEGQMQVKKDGGAMPPFFFFSV